MATDFRVTCRWHDARMKEDPNAISNPKTWADTQPSQWGPELAKIEIPLHEESEPEPKLSPTPAVMAPARLSSWVWMREGLRAAVFLAPRTAAAVPTPWQLLWVWVIISALTVGSARLKVVGPADFDVRNWLSPMWTGLVVVWLAWWAMSRAAVDSVKPTSTGALPDGTPASALSLQRGGLAAWYVLSSWAPLTPLLLVSGISSADVHRPTLWEGPVAEVVLLVIYVGLALWALVALVVLSARFIQSRWRTAVFAASLVVVVGLGTWLVSGQPWVASEQTEADVSAQPTDEREDAQAQESSLSPDEDPPLMALSQRVFENQQALWKKQVDDLLPERPGVVDVYGLVFAPYAEENVFRRESTMVSTLLQERFDAKGRVLHLLNHADTAATHAWATPENLQRAVAALGARMDREHDVLVIYMTSHGARNHELAAANWPLEVAPATPEMLRAALDAAGIRNRVIAVSACYSGGWIPSLETDHTLVMTAADATHTSYGCGSLSPLTFFGRAVFDEQLRTTHSFADAFAKAVPVIAQREVEAGKADGFSNPQIRVGSQIAPVLRELEQRLDAAALSAPTAPGKAKAESAAATATASATAGD